MGPTLAIASGAFGVVLLRVSWARRGGGRWLTAAGWLTLPGGAFLWHIAGMAWDKAIAAALLGPCVVAFVLLVPQAEWRSSGVNVTRTRLPATADTPVGSYFGRGLARTLVAAPVALAAALGLAAFFGLRMPWSEATRLVTAGLLLPVFWATGAIWATMDRKLARVAIGLIAMAVIGMLGATL